MLDFDGGAEILAAWCSGLAPDPVETVTEWADEHRYLSSRGASEPGKYRSARTPYLREIMDALSVTSPAKRVVFMKSAQIGATEAGNNWLGYCIHRVPGSFMMVQAGLDGAKKIAQQRIDPMIEDSPVLKERIAPSRSRDSGNTTFSKRFPGGHFVLVGANSAKGLRSTPVRFLFLDEVDGYPGDVEGEGDPVGLAEARTMSFGHRKKIFLCSTPTIQGVSRIEREFAASDQRRYFVPCPHCGTLQWLKWERLRWPKGLPDRARYHCEGCDEPIEERHKTWMMDPANGAGWRATAPEDVLAEAAAAGVVGYHLSGLYSPLGWLSWEDMARKREEAERDESKHRTFKNTLLGEVWQEKGEAPDWERVYERREDWRLGTAPEGVLVLTAGVDVQRDRLEVSVWGWGRELRSWLVDHRVLEGDTARPEVWDKLTAVLGETWPHASGQRMQLAKMAVDSGDQPDVVYSWVRRQGRGQVLAIKGVGGFDRSTPVDGPSYVEVTEGGRRMRRGVQLWKIAGAVFKSETYRFLRLPKPTDEELAEGKAWPAGYMHIPKGITAEWVRQLTAEQLLTIKGRGGYPKLEWRKTRERNEALDCRVYARACAWLMGLDRWEDRRWEQMEMQLDPAPADDAEAEPMAAGRTDLPQRRRRRAFTPSYMR
jgi:phage terminase large subunit GpA-like protein